MVILGFSENFQVKLWFYSLLRLEIENARLEAANKEQTSRIEILQKDLQNSASVSQSSYWWVKGGWVG